MSRTAPSTHSSQRAIPLAEALSNRRPNSFGFLRWVLAAMVVIDHSFPISGLGGGRDPMWQWSKQQDSLGGIAVAGFFIISGFLVCRSWNSSRNGIQYLWKRFLRIFPGYWICLVVTAFVFAPLTWVHEVGSLRSGFFAGPNGPFQYVYRNLFLHIHQWGIHNLLSGTPYKSAWDGSLWTLIYEFKCYLLLGLLGFVGLLRHRRFVAGVTFGCYLLTISWQIDPTWAPKLMPVLGDVYVARFAFLFLLGSTLALFADQIVVDDRLGVASAIVAVLTLHYGGWLMLGYPAMSYSLFWLAARLPMHWWDRIGDLSYGTYIYAFPVQMMLADHAMQKHGIAAFVATSLALTTIPAVISWHLIEKRALSLKGVGIAQRLRRLTSGRSTKRSATTLADTGDPTSGVEPGGPATVEGSHPVTASLALDHGNVGTDAAGS